MIAGDLHLRIARIVLDEAAVELRLTPAQWHGAIVAALESRIVGGAASGPGAAPRSTPLQSIAASVADGVHGRLPIDADGGAGRST